MLAAARLEQGAGDQTFDHYNAERLRAADTLLQGGHAAFLATRPTGRVCRMTYTLPLSGVRLPG